MTMKIKAAKAFGAELELPLDTEDVESTV